MAIPTKALATIIDRALAHFRTSFPGKPLGTKKFLGRVSRAVGLNVWGLQKSIEDVDLDIVPTAQSSTDALSEWAFTLGLPDGAGGFGRLLATVSSGGAATLTGVQGTFYAQNLTATAEDGVTQVKLSAGVSIPGSSFIGLGSIGGTFVSVTTGTTANLPVGTVLSWDSPPSGSDPTFALTSAMGGALDVESNADVYARIVTRLQTPPRGGSASDYVLWAQEGAAGVTNVYVYPRRQGTGTVDIVVTTGGVGQNRRPSSVQLAAAQTNITNNRPCAVSGANALAPHMPNASGHVVRVRVVPSKSAYNFDWDDTAAVYFVDLYTVGSPSTIRLNVIAPASLKSAIDAYNAGTGTQPRLQVISTRTAPIGTCVNPSIGILRTTDATSWVDGGGKTTLKLDTPASDWVPPTIGDPVFAYGPVVESIATGIQSLVNQLGPARISGYADPLTAWRDKLTISGIVAVAEDAIDTDGTEFIAEVPVGFATINGFALDVTPQDNTPNPPEILYLKALIVSQ